MSDLYNFFKNLSNIEELRNMYVDKFKNIQLMSKIVDIVINKMLRACQLYYLNFPTQTQGQRSRILTNNYK